jgi:hypothetical protein
VRESDGLLRGHADEAQSGHIIGASTSLVGNMAVIVLVFWYDGYDTLECLMHA